MQMVTIRPGQGGGFWSVVPLTEMLVKDEERKSRSGQGEPSDHDTGLTPVKREGEGEKGWVGRASGQHHSDGNT